MTVGRHAVRAALAHWHDVLTVLTRELVEEYGAPTPFTAEDIAALIASAFVGAEALILLGYEERIHPVRRSLRQIGETLAAQESQR